MSKSMKPKTNKQLQEEINGLKMILQELVNDNGLDNDYLERAGIPVQNQDSVFLRIEIDPLSIESNSINDFFNSDNYKVEGIRFKDQDITGNVIDVEE